MQVYVQEYVCACVYMCILCTPYIADPRGCTHYTDYYSRFVQLKYYDYIQITDENLTYESCIRIKKRIICLVKVVEGNVNRI